MFTKDIGIDLGTANTLVFAKNKGIVVNEPSVVAVNTETHMVLAVGNEAKEMIGRTPASIIATRPMKDGVIADFETTQAMLRYFIGKVIPKGISTPRIVICVPSGVTEVEKRAVIEAAVAAGAKEKNAYLIEEPMAAAIGAGLSVEEPIGNMIVDIGGGTSEVAVISLGGIVTSKSVRIAGDEFDSCIVNYVKKKYNLAIGERSAEEIKIRIGCAYLESDSTIGSMQIRGRDLISGLPMTITITATEVLEALNEPINTIIDAIKFTLEKTPPELASDIMESGIVLAGGGALLRGLDVLVSRETGMPVKIAPEPLNCVALGTGLVLENIGMLRTVLISSQKLKI